MGEGDISLSFLPLSHITARHVDLAVLFRGASLAYVGFVEQLTQALKEVRPTFLVGVPRVYEKVHASVEEKAKHFPGQLVLSLGASCGTEASERSSRWKYAAFSCLEIGQQTGVLKNPRRNGRTGEVLYFRWCASWPRLGATGTPLMGIRLHEGYGLTETSPVIAVNTPGAHKLGTVGKPLSNVAGAHCRRW